ncbi:MAG: BMP family ABC transporter substrate-binding protein [Jatrophihabitantaceae bacterium]
MIRRSSAILAVVASVSLLVTACGSSAKSDGTAAPAASTPASTSAAAPASSGGSPASSAAPGSASGSAEGSAAPSGSFAVAYMVPGSLGDLGFFDSGEAGIKRAASDLGATTKTIEGGDNNTQAWVNDLQNLAKTGTYNVIVTGGDQVSDQLTQVAKQFPKQKFVMFDAEVPGDNIASITFRQNDVSFLAGVLAALVSEDTADYPMSGGGKNVGIVGGQDIPVINDFIVGFEAGAKAVDPSITIQKSYVGSWTDSNTGYNQAASMYAKGADVIFAAAGGSGLGVLKAAKDKKKYAIGVDSDQNALYPGFILASALKNVNNAVFDLAKKDKEGQLKTGQTYVYGIANNGVELKLDTDLVKQATADKLKGYSDKVAKGEIDVPCVDPFCAKATI